LDDDETPAYKLQTNNYGPDDERKEVPFAGGSTFQEQLIDQLQLRNLDPRQYQIAEYLIGNLDEDGYLRRELFAISDDMAFSQNLLADEKELEYFYTSPKMTERGEKASHGINMNIVAYRRPSHVY
jgi:RNA polymerase sigma-54 factor